ncbi:hypothetical protein [Haloarchaeobius sp. HME9146]|uniref:hypothetical protein n=1 Tax=Haloarchaeobius sp. HME9146 TaxID=2978732 RepID=UPI0021BEE805|nr:hypothetical protein [Haloarchaeobius sp. HME9146]MCT9095740.1 hypothetical protein [Haloarchaeobius sp. HME9146]
MPEQTDGAITSEPTTLGRVGRSIPMLLPAWFATYPAGWLLGQFGLGQFGTILRWSVLLVFAFYAADLDNDPNGAIVFSVVAAVVFFAAQVLFAPAVPTVQGKPVYLLGPTLNVVGAYLLGYLLAYRDGLTALLEWATPDQDANAARDDS